MSVDPRTLNKTNNFPALGIWNTRGKGRYPIGANITATNVDLLVDAQDKIGYEGRDGFTLSRSFTGATAAYSTGSRMFVVDSGVLKEIFQDLSSVSLATGMGTGEYEFVTIGSRILVLGANSKMIVNNEAVDFFVPQPVSPTVEIVGGDLPAGQYTFAITAIAPDGREGPASLVHTVETTEDAGFLISAPPLSGYTYKAYVTSTNGEVLYELGSFTDTINFTGQLQLLVTPISEELVGSSHVSGFDKCEYHESQLWVSYYDASTNTSFVFNSFPFWPHLFKPQSRYIAVKGEVHSLDSNGGALVITTPFEIFAYKDDVLTTVADYGTVKGDPTASDDATDKLYVWTTRGVCEMFPFKNLTEEKVSLPPGSIASTAFLDVKGARRFLVLTDTLGYSFNKY